MQQFAGNASGLEAVIGGLSLRFEILTLVSI